MQFGDEIQMLRDYDDGRFAEGAVYVVAIPGEPEDGKVAPHIAQSLCRPANDGRGPRATKVTPTDDDEE